MEIWVLVATAVLLSYEGETGPRVKQTVRLLYV
jgi:hypothetical protein